MALRILSALLVTLFTLPSFSVASEPAYCDPAKFQDYEIDVEVPGTKRLHAFQLGSVKLVGVAVGNSDYEAVQTMAQELGGVSPEVKSCTWYLNKGNDDAAGAFNHRYVSRPYPWSSKSKMVRRYTDRLQTAFADDPINMVECAVDHGYLAMGCDGMKHRGPTVFAMLLAYSGCSAQSATEIANKVWGLNTVPEKIRRAVAASGFELGNQNPEARAALQNAFLGN